ncbi:hypothetical protein A2U01_0021631, partial [Trifolium medium]|nr:hypothetical protein [Trifolium medium]
GSVVIDAELSKKNHGSIPRNYDWDGTKPLDARNGRKNTLGNKPKLKEHMQYCVDHAEEIRKLAKVHTQEVTDNLILELIRT